MAKSTTRILIFTAMHERHVLSRLWCMAMKRFINSSPFICNVCAVVTHDESVDLCNEFGYYSVKAENRPLGAKFNAGMKYAIDNIDFDYVILFGDDDIIDDEAWTYYQKAVRNNITYCGFSGIYFWQPSTRLTIWFDYEQRYARNKLMGCGRMISREAIKRSGNMLNVKMQKKVTTMSGIYEVNQYYAMPEYRAVYLHGLKYARISSEPYFALWSNTQNTGLDHESELRLLFNGYEAYRFKTDSPLMVDIKTEKNIWPIGRFKTIGRQVSDNQAKLILSDEELEYIDNHINEL